MIKTNSKKAHANIQAYIMNNFDGCNYDIETPETFKETAAIILNIFHKERYGDNRGMTESELFVDWAAGLPAILDTCYYYNRSAVDDLGAILEETESEKARYTESAAESLLTSLIYRELVRGCK